MSAGTSIRRSKSIRSPLADALPPFAVRRFTVDEYHQLMTTGILKDGDPYELLDGWITPKMTKNPPHEVCLRLLHQAIGSQLPAGWMYDSQLAITLSTSEPEPDGMIVKGSPRDYSIRHPRARDLALVIEVAEASLDTDRKKAELYARDGVRRYWLINLAERVIEDYSQPTTKGTAARYKAVKRIEANETITCLVGRSVLSLIVSDVLP